MRNTKAPLILQKEPLQNLVYMYMKLYYGMLDRAIVQLEAAAL
mgnify:CR=1 FL=1